MKKEMNHILFANTRKFVIEQGSLEEPKNAVLAMTMNKNLERYGYTLDAAALKMLSTQTPAEMQKTWSDLVYSVREVTGASLFENAELFYPNFPEEVMKADSAHLYLNSLFYYTFAQHNDKLMDAIAMELRKNMVEEAEERLPLMEEFPRELNIINCGTEQDLFRMMNARIHSLGMSDQNLVELRAFANHYTDKFNAMISSEEPFQSKENKVKIAMMLHEHGKDDQVALMLKDSIDVLRYAAMLSKKNGITWNNVELAPHDGHNIAFKLTSAEQKIVKNLLNGCKNLYVDIWRQPRIFKNLMQRIKPTAKAGCPQRVIGAFDNLAKNRKLDENGNRIFTFELAMRQAVEALNKTGDAARLEKLAETFSANFLKSYVTIVRTTEPAHRAKAIAAVNKCAVSTTIAMKDVLTAKNAVTTAQNRELTIASGIKVATIYAHHGNKQFMRIYDTPARGALTDADYDAMRETLQSTAADMVKGYQTLGEVYVDHALRFNKAPGREMRDASGGATLVPHSIIPANPTKNLILFGINWGQPAGTHDTWIDVDTSVHFYGEDYEDKGYVSFNRLRHACAVHSGDYVQVPDGGTSTEAIVLDKARMRSLGIRFAVQEVHCFSIPSFKKAGNCHFVVQQREGSFDDVGYTIKEGTDGQDLWYTPGRATDNYAKVICKDPERGHGYQGNGKVVFMGKVFEPSAAEHNILLNSDYQTSVPCVYDAVEDVFYWLDFGLNSDYNRVKPSVTEDPAKMGAVIMAIESARNSNKPDMESLFKAYATHNGTLVEDITQAATVFVQKPVDSEKLGLREDARIITGFDLDIISKEFSGNDDLSQLEEVKEAPKTEPKAMVEPPIVKQLRLLKGLLDQYPHPCN